MGISLASFRRDEREHLGDDGSNQFSDAQIENAVFRALDLTFPRGKPYFYELVTDETSYTGANINDSNTTELTIPSAFTPQSGWRGAGKITRLEARMSNIAVGVSFTASASTDALTNSDGTVPANGTAVIVAGASLPTGLVQGTTYYVVNASTTTYKLSATSGGTAIDLTANGSGKITADPGVIYDPWFQLKQHIEIDDPAESNPRIRFRVGSQSMPFELRIYGIRPIAIPIYTCSAVASTDIITVSTPTTGTFTNGNTIRFKNTAPTGLTVGTLYYIVSASGQTFKVSLTSGGTAVDITADSSGTFYQLDGDLIPGSDHPGFQSYLREAVEVWLRRARAIPAASDIYANLQRGVLAEDAMTKLAEKYKMAPVGQTRFRYGGSR